VPLDPYLRAKAEHVRGMTFADLSDPAAVERLERYRVDDEPWAVPAGVSVRNERVDGPGGPVAVRVYTPDEVSSRTLVWLHGGGFAYGDLDMHEAHGVAAELAARAGGMVVCVDYRLATPEVRFPAPVLDVLAVWRQVTAASPAGAGVPGLPAPALGGASAGAAIAVSAALRCRDEGLVAPSALLLAYPFLHFPNPGIAPALAAELAELAPLLRIRPHNVADMVRGYVGRLTDLPPEAMPGAARLSGLPRTSIVISEYDDLRPSAELFADQLRESGVDVETSLARGMTHGHLDRVPALPQVAASLEVFAAALRGTPGAATGDSAGDSTKSSAGESA
jgi:acetyl esterase/lipase